jgi:hypothetical protein
MIDHISRLSDSTGAGKVCAGCFFGPSDESSSVAAIGILFPMANIFARSRGLEEIFHRGSGRKLGENS